MMLHVRGIANKLYIWDVSVPAVHIDVIPSTSAPVSAPLAHPQSCDAGRDQTHLAQGAGGTELPSAPCCLPATAPGELGCFPGGWLRAQLQGVCVWAGSCCWSRASSAGLLEGIAHGLGASSALLCISWDPALVLSSECMPCSWTVLGLGHLASVSISLWNPNEFGAWQELEASRMWPCCQQLRAHQSKAVFTCQLWYNIQSSVRVAQQNLGEWMSLFSLAAALSVSYLPSCCSANAALILCSLHTPLPIHTFCTPGCQLCAQVLSRASSVPQAGAFLRVQSHQAKPACKPCWCLPSFHSRKDFSAFSPCR